MGVFTEVSTFVAGHLYADGRLNVERRWLRIRLFCF